MSVSPRIVLPVVLTAFCVCAFSALASAQASEQVQVKPPLLRLIDPPAADAKVADLEQLGQLGMHLVPARQLVPAR